MTAFANRLLRRSAAGEASLLALGAAAGQLVVVGLSPLLTRLFAPEDLGFLGIFSACVAVLSVVATLGYDQAIVGATSRAAALRNVAAAVLSGLVLCLGIPPILWGGLLLAGRAASGVDFALLVGLGTLPAIAGTAAQAWYIRQRSIRLVAAGTFANMSGRAVAQVGGGVVQATAGVLIGGEILGRVLALAVLDRGWVVLRAVRHAARYPASILQEMRTGRSFALFQMPSSGLDILLVWMPVPLVGLAYGAEWAGIITLVQRIGTAPASLIGQSLVQIYHQRAGRFVRSDKPALLRLTMRLFLVGLSIFVPGWWVLWAFGPVIFQVAFGDSWMQGGVVAAIWAPIVLLQVYSQVASRMLILVDRQFVRLVANSVQVAVVPVIILGAARAGLDLYVALAWTVCVSCVIYLAMIGTALWFYRR